METVLTFKDVKTIISPQHPFVIIGERINPTRRKKLAESMSQGDFSVVQEDAIRQRSRQSYGFLPSLAGLLRFRVQTVRRSPGSRA